MEKEKPDFSNMPTGDQVRAFMPQLESYHWEKYNVDLPVDRYKADMEKILREITGGFSLLFRWFDGSTNIPFNFYRVRSFDEIKNVHSRSEYSYPPATVLSHQRANLPGYPAFYTSDHPLTAILEVIKSHHNLTGIRDKQFCLSVWKIKGEQSAVLAPLLYDGIPEDNPYYEFGRYQRGKEPVEMKESFTPEQIDGCEEMQKFFSRIFQNDERYSISSFIAHRHMYNEIDVPLDRPELQFRADVLIYPSIRMDKKSINYAIHPNFVDEKMSLNTVYKIRMQEIYFKNGNPHGFKFSFDEYAVNDKSRLVWLKVNPEHTFFKQRLKEDFPKEDGDFSFEHFRSKQ